VLIFLKILALALKFPIQHTGINGFNLGFSDYTIANRGPSIYIELRSNNQVRKQNGRSSKT
jgi:hypothetical protein